MSPKVQGDYSTPLTLCAIERLCTMAGVAASSMGARSLGFGLTAEVAFQTRSTRPRPSWPLTQPPLRPNGPGPRHEAGSG